MNLSACCLCSKPVLELEGQFAKLDTYCLTEGDELLVRGIYGECHSACLIGSQWGPHWAERLLVNLRDTRRLQPVGESGSYVALRNKNSRTTLLLRRDGLLLVASDAQVNKRRQTASGWFLPIKAEFNLELSSEPDLIADIQRALLSAQTYPLPSLIDALHLTEQTLFPAALERGALHFDKQLKRYWNRTALSASIQYESFIPAEACTLLAEP